MASRCVSFQTGKMVTSIVDAETIVSCSRGSDIASFCILGGHAHETCLLPRRNMKSKAGGSGSCCRCFSANDSFAAALACSRLSVSARNRIGCWWLYGMMVPCVCLSNTVHVVVVDPSHLPSSWSHNPPFGRRATATARHPFFRTAGRRELIWHCTRRDPSRVGSCAANTRYPSLSLIIGSVSFRLASPIIDTDAVPLVTCLTTFAFILLAATRHYPGTLPSTHVLGSQYDGLDRGPLPCL
jgi:hypothetical protein